MPCNAEFMRPNEREKELSAVLSFLDELDGSKFNHKHALEGYHSGAYCVDHTQKYLDKMTAKLCKRCSKLSKKEIRKKSLELQIWWRDHQEGDKRRSKKS